LQIKNIVSRYFDHPIVFPWLIVHRYYYNAKKSACFSSKCMAILVYILAMRCLSTILELWRLLATRWVQRLTITMTTWWLYLKNNYNFIMQCINIHCMGSTKHCVEKQHTGANLQSTCSYLLYIINNAKLWHWLVSKHLFRVAHSATWLLSRVVLLITKYQFVSNIADKILKNVKTK